MTLIRRAQHPGCLTLCHMHSDRNTKEPGSLVWQSTYSSVVTITSSHCPHLQEAHPFASRTQTSLTQTPIMLLPSRAPHTQVLHPTMGSFTRCFTQPWGPSHGVNIPGGPSHNFHGCASDDLTAGHPTAATTLWGGYRLPQP